MDKKTIIKWLDKKGFPFEMECLEVFKSKMFTTQSSLHYTDLETEKIREIDFIAFKQIFLGDFTFNLSFIVECKDSLTPWFAMKTRNDFNSEDFSSNIKTTENARSLRRLFHENELNTFSYNIKPDEFIAYNVQQINTRDDKGNTKASTKDMAFEGMQQALNCCASILESANKSPMKFANIYIPVLITSNEIYSLNSDDEIKEENLNKEKFFKYVRVNSFSQTPLDIIHIVAKEYLEEYCHLIEAEFHIMGNALKEEITRISIESPSNSNEGKYSIY